MEIIIDGAKTSPKTMPQHESLRALYMDIEKDLNQNGRIPDTLRVNGKTLQRDEIDQLETVSPADCTLFEIDSRSFQEFTLSTSQELKAHVPGMLTSLHESIRSSSEPDNESLSDILHMLTDMWTIFNTTMVNIESLVSVNLREIRYNGESIFDNITHGARILKKIKTKAEEKDSQAVLHLVEDEICPLIERWEGHLDNLCRKIEQCD